MKILYLKIKCCDDCPYMKLEEAFHTMAPARYECKKEGYKQIGLKYDNKEMVNPPEWCPLPDKNN